MYHLANITGSIHVSVKKGTWCTQVSKLWRQLFGGAQSCSQDHRNQGPGIKTMRGWNKVNTKTRVFQDSNFLLFYWNILYVCVWCHSTVGVAVSHPSITPLKLNSSRNWQKVKWWVWTVGICLVRPQWSEPSQQVFWQTLRTPSLILLVPAKYSQKYPPW